MKKPVCFLYDSSSSIKEGEFPDTYVLPLMVQDCTSSKQYFDGVNITTSKIERALIKGHQFKTSSSQPDDVLKILTKLSKKYETIYVFLIPMTLSPGQNNTVTLISKEFDNVIIVPHYMVTLMAKWECSELIELKKQKKLTLKTITNVVNKYRDNVGAALIVPDLSFLIKGGRIGKTKGIVASLLKIKALASFDRDGVSFRSKALSNNKLPSLINDYFDLIIPNFDYSKVEKVGILTSSVKDKNFDTNLYVDLIENKIISKINKNVKVEHASLPSVIIAHTGPNYTALVLLVKSKKN